jgi:hypothetical protein
MFPYTIRSSPKKKKKKPTYYPYRSLLEKRIATRLDTSYEYEPKSAKLDYMVLHKYTPDFVSATNKNVVIEVKGYFRTSSEATKYVHIKRYNPEIELIFIFGNPFKKAHPNCRPRKNGTLLTLAEWCGNHEFLYYSEKKLPKEIITGKTTEGWIKKERKRFGYVDSK